jgi:hypothetical protein
LSPVRPSVRVSIASSADPKAIKRFAAGTVNVAGGARSHRYHDRFEQKENGSADRRGAPDQRRPARSGHRKELRRSVKGPPA